MTPYPNGQWLIQGGRLRCRLAGRVVELRAPAALLVGLHALCDGRRSRAEIEARLAGKWSRRLLGQFLDHLIERKLLCDAGELLDEAARLGWYPGLRPQLSAHGRRMSHRRRVSAPDRVANQAARNGADPVCLEPGMTRGRPARLAWIRGQAPDCIRAGPGPAAAFPPLFKFAKRRLLRSS